MARDNSNKNKETSFGSTAMASVPLSSYTNLVSSSSLSHPRLKIRSRSTAQMCLEKILQIISSCPRDSSNGSLESMNRRSETYADGGKAAVTGSFDRIEIDLNLRLGPLLEIPEDRTAEEERGSSACSGIGKSDGCNSFPESGEVTTAEKSSQGECYPKLEDIEEEEEEEEEGNEEADHPGKTSPGSEEGNRVEEGSSERKNEGYLDLLLEAVRQISGDFEDEPEAEKPVLEPEPVRCCRPKRKNSCRWMTDFYGDFEDTAPVVRSKRGRNQVLPSRYRDSVLEPWIRLTRRKL